MLDVITYALLRKQIAGITPTGPAGPAGADGKDGQSAYAAAQAGGYTGTETTFYADLAAMQNLAAELAAM